MKFFLGFTLQIIVASSLFAQDGAVVEQTACHFPSYEQAVQTTDVERYDDKTAYETAVNDNRFEFLK